MLLSEYKKFNLNAMLLLKFKNAKQDEFDKLMLYFNKWKLMAKLLKTQDDADDEASRSRKYFGLVTLMNGTDKLSKRNGLRTAKPKLDKYLGDQLRQKAVGKLLRSSPKFNNILKRNYFNKWRKQVHLLQMKDFRDNVFGKLCKGLTSKMRLKYLSKYFQQWRRSLPKNTNINFFNGCTVLQKAVWRKTYKDPLKALKEKEEMRNMEDNLLRLLGIKNRYIKNHWKDYFYKWRNIAQRLKDQEIKNGFIASLLNNMLNARKRRILSNRFNKWRKVPKIDMADIFEKYKQMIKMTELTVDKSLKPTKKELLRGIKSRTHPKAHKKALNMLLERYLMRDRMLMRNGLMKWRDQCKNITIYELQMKLLRALGGRNDLNNRKLTLSRAFNNWKSNALNDELLEKLRGKKDLENKL